MGIPMPFRAVFFDFGGVILRTEYQSPRQGLAERFNMDYEEIEKVVFGSESSRRASLGEITEETHWLEVLKRLKLPASEMTAFQDAFFGGDVIDRELVQFIRSLRGKVHTGLISNAWSGLRDYLAKEKLTDLFETLVISAEVGVVKPEARIYNLALERSGVRAEEAAFVDDFAVNVEGSEKVGMRGVLFKDPQEAVSQLKKLLTIP
ncbi:MAG: HAD family phosphatase [Chloroflexi bacterium]|nr:HAD family phosphatase [Chloroflexota bacterium]